jgi:DNA-directed RNA polymerase specialized sigma24 family protein
MQWNWQTTQRALVAYRDTRRMSDALVSVIQSWIESRVRRFGDGLDEEDAIQELWVYILDKLIPKLEVDRGKKNWHIWFLCCLERELCRMKKRSVKRKERDYGNVQASNGEA